MIFAISHSIGKKAYWPISLLTDRYNYLTYYEEKLNSSLDDWSLRTDLGSYRIYENPYGPTIVLLIANFTPGAPYCWNKFSQTQAEKTKNLQLRESLENDTPKLRIHNLNKALKKLKENMPSDIQRLIFWGWDTSMSNPGGLLHNIFTEFAKDKGLPLEIMKNCETPKRTAPNDDLVSEPPKKRTRDDTPDSDEGVDLTYAPKKSSNVARGASMNTMRKQLFPKQSTLGDHVGVETGEQVEEDHIPISQAETVLFEDLESLIDTTLFDDNLNPAEVPTHEIDGGPSAPPNSPVCLVDLSQTRPHGNLVNGDHFEVSDNTPVKMIVPKRRKKVVKPILIDASSEETEEVTNGNLGRLEAILEGASRYRKGKLRKSRSVPLALSSSQQPEHTYCNFDANSQAFM